MTSKNIEIDKRKFKYKLKRQRGIKSIRLAIYPDGNFVVTAPRWYPLYIINRFVGEKSGWIVDKLKNIDFADISRKKKEEAARYRAAKASALLSVRRRVAFFNRHYNFLCNKITVKNQKTCWGSASSGKNLNFNYKIIDLPEELQDYIIVHELCHLKELNHSQKFWELVGETTPDYKELRKKLKNNKN